MFRKKGLLIMFVAGLAVGLMFGPVVARSSDVDMDSWRSEFFEPLSKAVQQIQMQYVEEVSPGDLLKGAYHGMLRELDDHSDYIPPDRLEGFQEDAEGEFGGLGIQIRYDPTENILRVEQPIPGTPAFQQGVLAGDIITNIYDEEKDEDYDPRDFETVHDAVSILRGDEGSEVTIRVLHRDSGEEEEITIERDIISVPGARSARIVDPEWKIGYVYVAQFHEKTADDLREALEELKDEGIDALVVDLRFNPGGLLKSAIDVADMFLHDSTVVSTRGRSVSEETFSTHSDDMLVDAPIAVLVNGYSASASEIVAGAIKDNDRGLIVGDTTFGKASVQSILPLGEDGGALKLTTAKYYTPSGNLIDGEGVQPHIKVDLDDADNRKLAEIIADEDDYPPILSTDDDDKDRPSFPSAYREEGELDETVSEGEEGDDEPFIDDQLLRAVDVLKATLVERSTEAKKRAESEQE